MISVSRRLSQALSFSLTGRRQPPFDSQHDTISNEHNMVVSSRSSRGRPNLRSASDHDSSQASSPVTAGSNTTSPLQDRDHHSHASTHNSQAQLQPIHNEETASTRAKRNRLASVSDPVSLQKRRRLSGNAPGPASGPPQVHIPLRGRAAQPSQPGPESPNHKSNVVPNNTQRPVRPPLVTHESTLSNSPLNSPSYKPQYDQFKRIEEKAQRIVQKYPHQEEKRKLRSEHGSTRSKTELAQYFPNFDDMLSLDPIDPNLLNAKTPVVLVDDTPNFEPAPPQSDYFRSQQPPWNSEIVDIRQYVSLHKSTEDPLADTVFLKAHQKAERHEKQMKNGDKERAQHEKYQLERLLEELRGPDWLKTLGISGITDTEKKRYEVKRALFIRETKALIDKFKRWKEEEKRRKIEKQQQTLEEAEAAEEESVVKSPEEDQVSLTSSFKRLKTKHKRNTTSRNHSRANSHPTTSSGQQADSSDIDALAAQQLLEEAKLASMLPTKTEILQQLPSLPILPEKPFTSFFEKRHIRDAAVLGRNRGRKQYAFGQELPELEDYEFELPNYILTDDAIRASQRSRRRRMRNVDE